MIFFIDSHSFTKTDNKNTKSKQYNKKMATKNAYKKRSKNIYLRENRFGLYPLHTLSASKIIATEIKNPKRFFEPIYKKHKKTSPSGLVQIIGYYRLNPVI